MMMAKVREEAPLIGREGKIDPLVWIVVQSNPSQERRAKVELQRQGFEVYLPMLRYQDKRGVTMARPFLARYLFTRVTIDVERWQTVYGTYGVNGVVGQRECPIGVKDRVIDRIKASELEGYVQFEDERLGPKMEEGALYRDVHTGLEGLFKERVDGKRVVLLTQLLGEAPLTVDIRRLKRVA